jgi:hypothetical protein
MQVTTNNHLKVCLIQPPYVICASQADACFDFKLRMATRTPRTMNTSNMAENRGNTGRRAAQ